MANCAKHAHASVATIAVQRAGDVLSLSISDDGGGGANPAKGSGLVGLMDRVEAFGGTVHVTNPLGAGTTVHVRMPVDESVVG
ncbi:MAG: putative two-component system sensor kinase [Pseudonocardiales bacterium]|nr:putative two-component system sensor kinase [Pseudonocardiales bacterium]